MTERIEGFRDLRVYQAAFELQQEVYKVSKSFPFSSEIGIFRFLKAETQHWLDTALNCKYIGPEVHASLLEKCQEIGRMLGTMINKPSSFCRHFSK